MTRRASRLDEKAVDRFFAAVRRRLRRGALEYGDASFARPARDLVAEIEAELHDVAGWAFVLCERLRRLRRLARRVDRIADAHRGRRPTHTRARARGRPPRRDI